MSPRTETTETEEHFLLDGEEVVITPRLEVSCDGGGGALGHPVEFLTLEKGGEAVCKYCDRRFVHVSRPEVEEIRRRGQPFAG
ncbi:MAG TPA: zinc-finger domain-containing protein [Rhodospirillales bacterium]|nr:zinc-finger domain-containing protein [Rhodospirillales bacterium]